MNSPEKPDVYKPFRPDGDIDMGLVRFDSEANVFRIYMGQGYNGTYDMEADRILSGGGFLDFLLHRAVRNHGTGESASTSAAASGEGRGRGNGPT